MSWHAHCGPRRSETGKFRSQAKLGTEKSAGGQYRDWFYSFVTHETGSGVRVEPSTRQLIHRLGMTQVFLLAGDDSVASTSVSKCS